MSPRAHLFGVPVVAEIKMPSAVYVHRTSISGQICESEDRG